MASSQPASSSIIKDGNPISAIPVGLKEAALDSPSFRATAVHFAEQIDLVEKWLDGFARSAVRLNSELMSLETAANSFISNILAPGAVSEAVIDHDYAFLALKRYGESVKDFWNGAISTAKKSDSLIAEPIRAFIQNDLRQFKETRRTLESTQKQHDTLQIKYAGQGKSKEPSSLREDAFQLHEARKAYLKASMEFCIQSQQIKNTLDKLIVRVSCDQWRELRILRDTNSSTLSKWGQEMDRIKGWTNEMETSEKLSKRDLLAARKQIEEAAELAVRPSRELDDYAVSTVPYLGSHGPTSLKMGKDHTFWPEKQGWLSLRILTGKPTRTAWVRRWTFLRNGIFGCLVQGARTGGVEESERIGVLLCSIRPAFQEERRFCFEVKTKNNTIMLQAETQKELTEWIGSFEAAKRKALDSPYPTSLPGNLHIQDPAFSISQPPAPEFAADSSESLTPNTNDEASILDRSSTAPLTDRDGLAVRNSSDLSSPRRSTAADREDGGKDHTTRIIQKLDIHRRATTGLHQSGTSSPQPNPPGIASLISASHSLLPLSAQALANAPETETKQRAQNPFIYNTRDTSVGSLAPPTLANPPAHTSMSRVAVVVSTERGVGVRFPDGTGGIPTGMMANLWGSSHWGYVNRLGRNGVSMCLGVADRQSKDSAEEAPGNTNSPEYPPPTSHHRQTVSLGGGDSSTLSDGATVLHEYPSYFPAYLKPHDAQFRLLFPNIPGDETLLLVFRAFFSLNDQQDFPGRVYVTTRRIYFYSNHFSLVLTSCADLDMITEVTAAPGRDCDFLFLHLAAEEGSDIPRRLTIKTFLDPLKLIHKRLNYLVGIASSNEPPNLESIFKSLVKMEQDITRTPSMESWEDVSLNTPVDGASNGVNGKRSDAPLKPVLRSDHDLDMNKRKSDYHDAPRFKLPSQPVEYVPQGALYLAAEKFYDISSKALFHILFGDKSAVWQLLQHQRRAQNIRQGPWSNLHSAHLRRDIQYQINMADTFRRLRLTDVSDYQILDVLNDHLCYVVTDKRTPWHLPFKRYFRLVSKIVITHVSKSRCKLAIFTKVEWLWEPYLIRSIIDRQALNDLEQDALDLVDLVSEEVKRLGPHNQTKRAIAQFGHVGRQTRGIEFTESSQNLKSRLRRPVKQSGIIPLLLETSGSLLQSAVSSLMIWFWVLLRWIWKTCSAHSIILLLLAFSMLINGYHSYHDTVEWWHERNAGNFMTRLGVGPNRVMSKAVYIKDMDIVVANATEIDTGNSSSCFSTFRDNNALRSADLPRAITTSATKAKDSRAKGAAQQLQRTRERLGIYRHNLLVALRVVNRIEKEVIQAEWERWLHQETQKCQVIEILLNDRERLHDRDHGAGGDSDEIISDFEKRFAATDIEDIQLWYQDYCLSCQRELEKVRG
ncbi:SipA3 [Blastomyces dermatitidis ER-3]|uniref:SipA3 n=1 Tax=Ajellomyces dermatitidis (strain ER-3 / ATCC MYA-2586) TaxID=559297 RepID=A0ABP2EKM9_AJEDR|nr:SipA3 [Blastomyces dermatitidis ER-3]EEQ83720.2 SipA3 [Blastomyces dermatitidis ER-3]